VRPHAIRRAEVRAARVAAEILSAETERDIDRVWRGRGPGIAHGFVCDAGCASCAEHSEESLLAGRLAMEIVDAH